uniref:AA_permease domain-containing protein n=1 Tax=Bursaphelenchus xylophilus TaxID=6326 RepID=A0A1I7SS92_BURXY
MTLRTGGIGPKSMKLLNSESLLHSEWNRRLGICSLVAIGGVVILSTNFGLLLTNLFAVSQSSSPPLTSVLIACFLYLIAGEQYRVISYRIPLNGLLYNLAFTSHSEMLAFVIGWAQVFDGIAFLTVLLKVLADTMKMLFNHRLEQPVPSESVPQTWPVLNYSEYLIILFSLLMMSCSLRVLSTVSIVFIVATLFTVTSTSVVALLHNVVHLQVHYIGFPYNYQEVMDGVEVLMIGMMAIECISYVSEETDHPRKTLPQLFPFLSRSISVILFLGTIAFFPFSYRRPYTSSTLLPSTFDTIGIFSARYLLNVGSVCGLSASVCVAFLGPSRILCQFAKDGIMPKAIGDLYGKGGSPRLSVFLVALISCVFALFPRPWLCSTLGCSIILRLFIQSILIYNVVLPNPKELEEENGNTLPRYNTLDVSRCSSLSEHHQSVIDSTYSEITSDDEEHVMERIWKVTANGNEETRLLNENCKVHNCLNSSCQANPGSSVWRNYHVYDAEDQYERPRECREQSTRALGIDKTQKNGQRAVTLGLISSILIALSSTIIRETPEYLPVMPVVTLIIGSISCFSVLAWISRIQPINEKERWIPFLSMMMVFVVTQLLFHIRILFLIPILTWNLIGIMFYFTFYCQRK